MKRQRSRCLSLSLMLCLLSLISVAGCRRTAPSVLTEDPILTFGHGTFLGADGRPVTPDRTFIDNAQRYYISVLTAQAKGKETLAVDRTQQFIRGLVTDEVLANALFIDWLIENVHPDDAANLTSNNGALRWHYLQTLDPRKPSQDVMRGKGIGADIRERLEAGGVKVLSRTKAGGADYIRECAAAGVPIPPPVFSSAWTNRGPIVDPFLSSTARAEVMHFTSTAPAGVCIALPRYQSTGNGNFSNNAFLFGLICLGTQSNKACFWDNPKGKEFAKGTPVDISEFVGGEDLVANNQGVCSDCHSGEDPYVVHPNKPPFAGLTPSLLPGGWYDPMVDASWPQNPGPTNLLDVVSSVGRCDDCHRVGVAGRFPEPSTQLKGWCGTVLTLAVGGAPTGTMPPPGFTKSQFTAHIDALKNACSAPPSVGVVVEVNLPDDKGHISPPVVIDPLYACASKVAVRGSIYGADVTVLIDGKSVANHIAKNPNFEEFAVPNLGVNQKVTATQTFNGTPSLPSAPITVRDHQVDFPSGLPAAEIDPELIYECADVVAVRNVPGATVTLFTNGAFPSSAVTSTGWTAMAGGKRPFVGGDAFTAQQALCKDTSMPSGKKPPVAVKEPSNIPAPTFNPPLTYSGQQLVTLETLINGSHTNVREATAGPLGDVTTPVSWLPNFDVATPLGRPLNPGDRLQASQRLCSKGPPTETPPTVRCESLSAPRISRPIVGTNYVVVTDSVPSARIRVYDAAGVELGDGSGTVVVLTRLITGTDVLTVVQQVGECTSKTGYRVSAGNVGSRR